MSGDASDSDAYIRVRGSILVYLPDGTGLVVNSNQLLRLDAATALGTHATPRAFRRTQ